MFEANPVAQAALATSWSGAGILASVLIGAYGLQETESSITAAIEAPLLAISGELRTLSLGVTMNNNLCLFAKTEQALVSTKNIASILSTEGTIGHTIAQIDTSLVDSMHDAPHQLINPLMVAIGISAFVILPTLVWSAGVAMMTSKNILTNGLAVAGVGFTELGTLLIGWPLTQSLALQSTDLESTKEQLVQIRAHLGSKIMPVVQEWRAAERAVIELNYMISDAELDLQLAQQGVEIAIKGVELAEHSLSTHHADEL
jgi:hypothetical protein